MSWKSCPIEMGYSNQAPVIRSSSTRTLLCERWTRHFKRSKLYSLLSSQSQTESGHTLHANIKWISPSTSEYTYFLTKDRLIPLPLPLHFIIPLIINCNFYKAYVRRDFFFLRQKKKLTFIGVLPSVSYVTFTWQTNLIGSALKVQSW